LVSQKSVGILAERYFRCGPLWPGMGCWMFTWWRQD